MPIGVSTFRRPFPALRRVCLLTFILCPWLLHHAGTVGGPADNMISGFIDIATVNQENDGSALGAVLLTATLSSYYAFITS